MSSYCILTSSYCWYLQSRVYSEVVGGVKSLRNTDLSLSVLHLHHQSQTFFRLVFTGVDNSAAHRAEKPQHKSQVSETRIWCLHAYNCQCGANSRLVSLVLSDIRLWLNPWAAGCSSLGREARPLIIMSLMCRIVLEHGAKPRTVKRCLCSALCWTWRRVQLDFIDVHKNSGNRKDVFFFLLSALWEWKQMLF